MERTHYSVRTQERVSARAGKLCGTHHLRRRASRSLAPPASAWSICCPPPSRGCAHRRLRCDAVLPLQHVGRARCPRRRLCEVASPVRLTSYEANRVDYSFGGHDAAAPNRRGPQLNRAFSAPIDCASADGTRGAPPGMGDRGAPLGMGVKLPRGPSFIRGCTALASLLISDPASELSGSQMTGLRCEGGLDFPDF
eukprot:7174207-Prymnesium_polylepis.1